MIRLNASKLLYSFVVISSLLALYAWYNYYLLQQHVGIVLNLKQQYADYVLTYRKLITTIQASEYDATDDQGCSFQAVNRDFTYLKESALDYAKDHRIEGMIDTIYDPEWVNQSIVNQQRRRTRRSNQTANRNRVSSSVPSVYRKEIQLQLPVDSSRFWLSSRFGPRKKNNGTLGFHQGIDMAALRGTPVKAAAAGKVVESSSSMYGYGNCIVIEHSSKYKTRYAHLDTIKVKQGDRVQRGQLIGTVGSTGSVRGVNGGKNASHLHFEVMVYGNRIDPLQVLN